MKSEKQNLSRHLFGVENGSFQAKDREKPQYSLLCGVKMCSNTILDVKLTYIEVDGLDATEKLLNILDGVNVDAIILGGITFAGFNIIDPIIIQRETRIPIIVYSGVKPDNDKMLMALMKHFKDWELRWDIIKSLGHIYTTKPFENEPGIYYEVIGVDSKWAEGVLHEAAIISRIPEPVRVAGLIARGLSPAF